MDYRYDACGLDNVILKGLPVVQDDDGEEMITIQNVGLLHRVLIIKLASKDTGLLPKELRFIRTEMGLTQAELAAEVGREVQAIGRWERGENPIDTTAEIVIRARALQTVAEDLPLIAELAKKTVLAASEPPILIDASDPADYRPMMLEAA
jgi:transcriptional regulator with XRE-family HTH domain